MLDFGTRTSRVVLLCCLLAWVSFSNFFSGTFRCRHIADATAYVGVLCVCSCPTHLEAVGATSPRCNDALRSAALISTPGTLYPQPYSNEMGGMAGPKMSQQDGNQRMLIKATRLQTATSKRLCRFSSFSPRAILTTKKDLPRLSYTPGWVLSL